MIYVCVYMCVCVNLCLFFKIHTCISVLSQNEVSFFPLEEPFLEPKKNTSFETYPCIQYIYLLTCVFCFYPVLVCPIQKICFLVFFCM